jgi:hypothetical protein
MVERKYVASLKGEKTEYCVRARDAKECDRLANTYSVMFVAAPAKVEPVSDVCPVEN